MTTSKSSTWRWVGVFILLVILFLLWLNGYGPTSSCCAQVEKAIEAPIVDSTTIPPVESVPEIEPVPEVTLQEAPVPLSAEVAIEVPACSADMSVAVEFDEGSATVSDIGMQQLDLVAKCLVEKTQVVGFTDNSGTTTRNQKLSESRAKSVVAYLVSQNPNMADLLTATGHGATDPIADNSTEEGRKKNRRIEFVKQ